MNRMVSVVPYGTRGVIGFLVQPLRSWLISSCPCGTKGRCKICRLLPLRRRKKVENLPPFVGKCRLLSPSVASHHGGCVTETAQRAVSMKGKPMPGDVPLVTACYRLFPLILGVVPPWCRFTSEIVFLARWPKGPGCARSLKFKVQSCERLQG